MDRNVFPKWTNKLRGVLGIGALAVPAWLVLVTTLGASPRTLNVGYAPEQPVPFSHALHAGDLAIDCRYCHTTVEKSAHAAIPPTSTCINCHKSIKTDSPKLALVRESAATGKAIRWKRVHDLPDYAYFDHSAHVTRGIGCVSCHGRIDQMDVVRQAEPLSMGWCLDCHRNPAQHLRPLDRITDMAWKPEKQLELGKRLERELGIHASTDCSTCHR